MKHALAGRLEEVQAQEKDLRQEAATKYAELEKVQQEVAKATGPLDAESDLFKKLDDAGKAYGELGDRLTAVGTVKERLVASMTAQGIVTPGGDDPDMGAKMAEVLDELRTGRRGTYKTAGQRITESDLWKEAKAAGKFDRKRVDVQLGEAWNREEVKALITGADPASAGAFVQPDRIGYFPIPQRPLTILDLITVGDTDSDLVEYVKMVSFTNAAAETAEAITAAPINGTTVTAVQGGRKPESAMDFEIVQEAVSTIAHWIPATKRALADAGQMRTIIDQMLRWGLDDRLERQLLSGNGVGENLLGLLNHTGLNTVGPGAASAMDKIHMGMTAVRLDNIEPDGIALNPLDWEGIRLAREDGTTGAYLMGSPLTAGGETLWGKRVVVTAAVPQGTAIVGAWKVLTLWMREGAQINASDSHEDYFTRNLVAVLAELRCASGLPLPQAFTEVNLAAA